ncbi:hypothetical protein CKK33_01835 [Mucilaginibacter sp. MD40]|uniref:hypothetical protein n=1 Tax=Mucilaginibacter sp. MD40 TaxID=2029590 RepID=UPI000BACB5A6|nr:hypothetical protein [Mucilaginibacter sp. MD40]PAW92298.1 hypothetical protein CKK33_01835 [Mucilaginibacter sp. MD40]
MKQLLIVLLILSTGLHSAGQITQHHYEYEPVLHGDTIVLPITLIDAFPFITGEVNGVKGKFMFDTGNQRAISINDHVIDLPKKRLAGKGIVGSGQTFNNSINDTIRQVKLGDEIVYDHLLNIKSGNYSYLEGITPDVIGYVGYDYFKGYIFKLDYIKRKVTFYKNTIERNSLKDFLAGEHVLAVIPFFTRKLPNHPMVKVKIKDVELLGAFDTGQYGLLQLTVADQKELQAKKAVLAIGADRDNTPLLNVRNINIAGVFMTDLKGVESATLGDTGTVRKALEITEKNLINIGYRFLTSYKTVWDYDNKKIYVLSY